MGLVGVAGLGGDGGEVRQRGRAGGVEQADEALEAEHALQRLGAVAEVRLAAPAELARAQADLGGDGVGARGRVPQQGRGPGHGPVRRALGRQRAGDGEHSFGRLGGVKRGRQPPRGGRQQIGQRDSLVGDLAQRRLQHPAARAGAEADADDDRSGLGHGAGRAGVRAGDVAADALFPDEIAAAVGQHQPGLARLVVLVVVCGLVEGEAGPQARHRAAQRGWRRPLRVPGNQPRARGHPVGRRHHATRMPRRRDPASMAVSFNTPAWPGGGMGA